MTKFAEITVEDAALSWFDESGYSVVPGQLIARESLAAKRAEFSDTPRQIEPRLAMGDSFMREILERGKVIYEADATSKEVASCGLRSVRSTSLWRVERCNLEGGCVV